MVILSEEHVANRYWCIAEKTRPCAHTLLHFNFSNVGRTGIWFNDAMIVYTTVNNASREGINLAYAY